MSTPLSEFNRWLSRPYEDEQLEFKEAKNQYDTTKLFKYCVALANEGGGKFILGVTDKRPRRVVGSQAFLNTNDIKSKILDKLGFRVDVEVFAHADGRALIFHIPPRPSGTAYRFEGAHLMRSGEELVLMSEDRLRTIFEEGKPDWLSRPARLDASADEVTRLLDTQSFFDLLKLPYPAQQKGVLERLESEKLIVHKGGGYAITNLVALLFAKKLDEFDGLVRKAPRLIVYDGKSKLKTRLDLPGTKGYAVGFVGLIDFINSQAKPNEVVGRALRREVKMYPEIAIRELVANALIHQDFNETGTSVMVEIYSDRIEISNPGKPSIQPERFIDEYQSRNEKLADLMRRFGICEERGSGVDKVVHSAEVFQLPAPDFRVGEKHTTVVLFSHIDFDEMDRKDRIRACYQHCCLRYVTNERMTNQSLRERFRLPDEKAESASRIIKDTIQENRIKLDDPESTSKRYAKYIPFWA